MKNSLRFLALLTWVMASTAIAQSDLLGIWEGELSVGPDQSITVQFTIEQGADGTYSGLLNAPDQPSLTDVPIDTVSIEQNSLNMEISAISGSYEGTIADSVIQGTWSQQGTTFELNLAPYQEPVLTQEQFARLAGSWLGTLRPVPGGDLEFTVIVTFEQNEEGESSATMSVPEQGRNRIPVDSIELDGDELTLEISQARVEIKGSLNGETFAGQWSQAGQSLALNLAKGEYEQPGLELSALDFARLQGPWNGQVTGLTVVLRVEEIDGQFLAFLDSPDQGASDIPIATLDVQGDELTLSIAALQVSYTAEISADELSGEWNQGGQTQPLVLARGPYVRAVTISEQAQQQLSGTW
ncbi:MAG: hypothetical protein QGG67_10330 [Gammaproteobacteria bacterium]|nr:hypothetical protein [Gammaproteobacteria bacterium]MDP6096364.1 hypothetical protein [Gammaproteobacteria bacterium]